MISAILLAAGQSKRMNGENKLVKKFQGSPLIKHSIENILTNLSMGIIYKTVSFPLELFIMMGDNYIGNKKLGREIHLKRVEIENTFLKSGKAKLKNKIYEKFADVGVGREFTVIAKMKNA